MLVTFSLLVLDDDPACAFLAPASAFVPCLGASNRRVCIQPALLDPGLQDFCSKMRLLQLDEMCIQFFFVACMQSSMSLTVFAHVFYRFAEKFPSHGSTLLANTMNLIVGSSRCRTMSTSWWAYISCFTRSTRLMIRAVLSVQILQVNKRVWSTLTVDWRPARLLEPYAFIEADRLSVLLIDIRRQSGMH